MQPFRTILVPVDYSSGSTTALRAAATLARAFEGRLLVLHLLPIDLYVIGDYPVVMSDGALLEKERARLEEYIRATLTDGPLPAHEVHVDWGSPFLDIVHVAAERHADLIVMSTHGRTGVRHLVLGSVAEKTVRLAPCPVLTVHAERGLEGVQGPAATTTSRAVPRGEVASWMRVDPATVAPGDSLEEARRRMVAVGARHIPVVDGTRLVGMLSDKDLAAHAGHLDHTKVDAAMTPNPVTVTADTSLDAAARLMIDRRVRALPVTDGERLIGIVSATDVLEDYVRAART
jgi:nucleotide-binding universal stress UspA family protein